MKRLLCAAAAVSLTVLAPGVVRAAETPNPEGPATLRIEVVAAGRDTGEPPEHRWLEVVNIETADRLTTVSTEQMLDPQGAPCPGVAAEICSVDLTVTVRALGTFLRVAHIDTNGPLSAFSADCEGGAGGAISGDPFGALRLATGEVKTCRVTVVRPDKAVGTSPMVALLVQKTFDFDTRGDGFASGSSVTLEAANGPVASEYVDAFHDLSDRSRPCPLIGSPPTCEWAVTFDDGEWQRPFRLREVTSPGWLPIFGGDCDRAGQLPLEASRGDLVECTIHNLRADETVGTNPGVALRVRKTFDFDTRGDGFASGSSVTLEAANGSMASEIVDHFHDLSNRSRPCPLIGPPPACEWTVIFNDDEWQRPFRLREETSPDWLPIFGGDCDRAGQLPLEASRGDLVECTIYNVGLEEELAPDRNAVIRLEVVAPGETAPSAPLPIDVRLVGSASGTTVYARVQLDGEQCPGLGPVLCASDVGVAVHPSRFSPSNLFWLTVPPGLTVGASGDCAGGTADGGVAAEVELRVGELKTCRLTVTLPRPLLQIAGASVVEGDSGLTGVALSVTLSRPQSTAVHMSYATANGSAAAPGDYTGTSGTLTFAPGQTLATIPLAIVGDIRGEPDETFLVSLSAQVGAVIQTGQASVTILNDDDRTPPLIAAKTDVIAESKVAPAAVLYTSPTAKDNLDGAVAVACVAKSGSAFLFGTTGITCTARDRNGNAATSAFNVVVRVPTTSGAVTNPGNDTPLTKVSPGRLVRVSAGGFAPSSPVTLLWLGPAGEMLGVGPTTAGENGRIDARAKVPESAPLGSGQMTAVGVDATGAEFVRAWRLEVRAE